jgi:hypothetical protein
MFRFTLPGKTTLAALTIGSGLLLAGCAATEAVPTTAPSALTGGADGVTCAKCQVTYARSPAVNDKGRLIRYETRKTHECPDCKDAVTNFFATGKFEHTCKTCGDTMELCEAH